MTASEPFIAVVDDEESIRRALLRLLRSAGLRGIGFASGAEFLAALGQLRPSCVILDLHMPGMGGVDVQEKLSKTWPELPVIVVTGHHSAETETQVRLGRPLAYLQKPLHDELLLGAIRNAIGAKS